MNEETMKEIFLDMLAFQKEQTETAAQRLRDVGGWTTFDHEMLEGVIEKYPLTCKLAARLEHAMFDAFLEPLSTFLLFLKSAPESLRQIGAKKFHAQIKCLYAEFEEMMSKEEVVG